MVQRKIESISIDRLIAHPANPNRMSEATFNKLIAHIKRTGNYEPVVARPHPRQSGCFEIINGHHRCMALRQLDVDTIDCVVWQLDDDEATLALATLNRLCGSDNLQSKSELIKSLSRRFDTSALAAMLPESKKSIERLKDLAKPIQMPGNSKTFLNSLVFFLTDEQKQTVEAAIKAATEAEAKATAAQKRSAAIVKMAEIFLNSNS